MITIPETRVGPVVKHYVNDEIHITGKQSKTPSAVITFLAVDDDGTRIEEAPVVTFTLVGDAFNKWYSGWDGETTLYSKIAELVLSKNHDIKMTGADFLRIGGIGAVRIPEEIDEVLNKV